MKKEREGREGEKETVQTIVTYRHHRHPDPSGGGPAARSCPSSARRRSARRCGSWPWPWPSGRPANGPRWPREPHERPQAVSRPGRGRQRAKNGVRTALKAPVPSAGHQRRQRASDGPERGMRRSGGETEVVRRAGLGGCAGLAAVTKNGTRKLRAESRGRGTQVAGRPGQAEPGDFVPLFLARPTSATTSKTVRTIRQIKHLSPVQ